MRSRKERERRGCRSEGASEARPTTPSTSTQETTLIVPTELHPVETSMGSAGPSSTDGTAQQGQPSTSSPGQLDMISDPSRLLALYPIGGPHVPSSTGSTSPSLQISRNVERTLALTCSSSVSLRCRTDQSPTTSRGSRRHRSTCRSSSRPGTSPTTTRSSYASSRVGRGQTNRSKRGLRDRLSS